MLDIIVDWEGDEPGLCGEVSVITPSFLPDGLLDRIKRSSSILGEEVGRLVGERYYKDTAEYRHVGGKEYFSRFFITYKETPNVLYTTHVRNLFYSNEVYESKKCILILKD